MQEGDDKVSQRFIESANMNYRPLTQNNPSGLFRGLFKAISIIVDASGSEREMCRVSLVFLGRRVRLLVLDDDVALLLGISVLTLPLQSTQGRVAVSPSRKSRGQHTPTADARITHSHSHDENGANDGMHAHQKDVEDCSSVRPVAKVIEALLHENTDLLQGDEVAEVRTVTAWLCSQFDSNRLIEEIGIVACFVAENECRQGADHEREWCSE